MACKCIERDLSLWGPPCQKHKPASCRLQQTCLHATSGCKQIAMRPLTCHQCVGYRSPRPTHQPALSQAGASIIQTSCRIGARDCHGLPPREVRSKGEAVFKIFSIPHQCRSGVRRSSSFKEFEIAAGSHSECGSWS